MGFRRFIIGVLVLSGWCKGAEADQWLVKFHQQEFKEIKAQISVRDVSSKAYKRLQQETLKHEALILSSDRYPSDVLLRRTEALLNDLELLDKSLEFANERSKLAQLRVQTSSLTAPSPKLFATICQLRRAIAFKNPLLNFDKIAFLKHHKQGRGEIHMVDQYLGFNAKKGGGVFVLENPFSQQPSVKNILADSRVKKGRLKGNKLNDGSFISLDLDYDGKTILFAYTEAEHEIPANATWGDQRWTETDRFKKRICAHYHFRPESTYHIFKANIDGTELTQLTDGAVNQYDPCFMPDGRIVYIAETAGAQRCGVRPLPTATLHSMLADGSDQYPISWHDTNEWHPSIDNNGLIVYTRWDYIDRDSDIAHHLWYCYPDGRDPRSMHGNYPHKRENRPWMELSIRAIPNSDKYIAVAAPHHGQSYGSLVLIDQKVPDDRACSQVKRVTPEVHFPESESAPAVPHHRGRHKPRGEVYGSPWPLSENYYLAVYDSAQKNYAICLVDSFGNKLPLYQDDSIPCLDPIPLRSRPRPPVIPSQTNQAQVNRGATQKGTVAVMNVYEGEFPMPKGTKIKELRIVAVFPKWNAFLDVPRIGVAAQSIARGVLGTVPVEEDGSVYFECPTNVEIYFQALDKKGQAVQTMRSGTYVHPGEHLSCLGCHEDKYRPPVNRTKTPLALKRAPSKISPEATGSYPLTFPRLVQPVLDRYCVTCHEEEGAPSLSGKIKVDPKGKRNYYGWSEAYWTLKDRAWGKSGGNGAIWSNKLSYSLLGKIGAKDSKLLKMLNKGHQDLKLPPEDLRRITLWLDCNSVFYGAYREIEKQGKGEIVMPKAHTIKGLSPELPK